jgi:hypothetical protein
LAVAHNCMKQGGWSETTRCGILGRWHGVLEITTVSAAYRL